ncbi:hypothetical protein CLF_111594, partial [Clonorchis sinensis]
QQYFIYKVTYVENTTLQELRLHTQGYFNRNGWLCPAKIISRQVPVNPIVEEESGWKPNTAKLRLLCWLFQANATKRLHKFRNRSHFARDTKRIYEKTYYSHASSVVSTVTPVSLKSANATKRLHKFRNRSHFARDTKRIYEKTYYSHASSVVSTVTPVSLKSVFVFTHESTYTQTYAGITHGIRKVRFLKATTECPRSTETLSSVDVDLTDNAPSIYSASQLSIKPRQRESALLKALERVSNQIQQISESADITDIISKEASNGFCATPAVE